MDKILNFIEKETKGTCYKSFKYSFDTVSVPTLEYEDKPKFSVKQSGETDTSLKTLKDLSSVAKAIQPDPPLFRYFLDGSRRVYKVDDIEYDKKIFPIIGGQIGVACCERVNPSTFKKVALENQLVLALPTCSYADGIKPDLFFNAMTERLNLLPKLKRKSLVFSQILRYDSKALAEGEKYEQKGIARIQDEMIECEKKIVAFLATKNLLNEDAYLIKDGSLQYKPMKTGDFKELSKIKSHYQSVIGVSKLFNPELSRDQHGKSNATQIAKLPLYHRTPAFMYQTDMLGEIRFSIWYLRIRDTKYTDSPFAGIIKVEKILISSREYEEGLDTDEIDRISANLINERSPVCYGSDHRWANHLYPVYLTEKYIKSKFISDIHFINLF